MRHYATLFDSRYLARGIVLLESLIAHSSEPFTLHVLAMDAQVGGALFEIAANNYPFPRVVFDLEVIHLDTLEYQKQLGPIRESRTWQEYCWMMASQFMEDLLSFSDIQELTYLDADMMLFSDPAPVFVEIGTRSIAITLHRLIPSKRHLEVNGKFNVGWISAKNTEVGRRCIERWAAQTRERCAATVGCGDQGYLDEWPSLYGDDLCIIQHIGVNTAPWNLANWKVTEGPCVDGMPVVVHHYHEFSDADHLTHYELRPEDIEFIYEPYLEEYDRAKRTIESLQVYSG